MTVLLVADDPKLLFETRTLLGKEGYEVHAFENPELATCHIEEQGCRDCVLVVSEIKMNGMSGFELVRRVKRITAEMKVVLMSPFLIRKGEFQKVMPSLHIDDFVTIPFEKDELMEAINKCATRIDQ